MADWFNKLVGRKKARSGEGTRLSDIALGHRAQIERVVGDEGTSHRLREMGFRESAVIEKVAESGAIICKVVDTRVAISKKLADSIFVNDLGEAKLTASEQTILLSQMTIGQRGIIRDYTADNEDYERIVEMGATPGETIEIIRYAPLGDPIEIRVRGYLLSLRKQEADRIKVSLLQ